MLDPILFAVQRFGGGDDVVIGKPQTAGGGEEAGLPCSPNGCWAVTAIRFGNGATMFAINSTKYPEQVLLMDHAEYLALYEATTDAVIDVRAAFSGEGDALDVYSNPSEKEPVVTIKRVAGECVIEGRNGRAVMVDGDIDDWDTEKRHLDPTRLAPPGHLVIGISRQLAGLDSSSGAQPASFERTTLESMSL